MVSQEHEQSTDHGYHDPHREGNPPKTAPLPGLSIKFKLVCLINVAAVLLVYVFLLRPILGAFFLDYARAFLPAICLAIGMALGVRLLSMTAIDSRTGLLTAQLALGAVLYGGLTMLFRREDVSEIAGLVTSRT